MQAMVDWSYGLLSPRERTVLARISDVLRQLHARVRRRGRERRLVDACRCLRRGVAAGGQVAGVGGRERRPGVLRLLETTRCYASSRLSESGELPALRRRHAEHVLELLRESEQAWRDADARRWRHRYGRHVDDVRTALDWAMSAEGDVELGIAITVRSALLLYQLSRADECMRFASAAMEALCASERSIRSSSSSCTSSMGSS
jgi:predicted ATPase